MRFYQFIFVCVDLEQIEWRRASGQGAIDASDRGSGGTASGEHRRLPFDTLTGCVSRRPRLAAEGSLPHADATTPSVNRSADDHSKTRPKITVFSKENSRSHQRGFKIVFNKIIRRSHNKLLIYN